MTRQLTLSLFGIRLRPLVCLLAILASTPFQAISDEIADRSSDTSADSGHTDQLVRQLGHPDFETREQAEQKLKEVGVAAAEAIRTAASSGDPEISRRCQRILRDILREDLQHRMTVFEAGGSDLDDSMPGWKPFRELIGNSAEDRSLYLRLLKAETGLLLSFDAGTEAIAPALQFRIQQYMQAQNTPDPVRRTTPSVDTTLMFLFVCSNAELLGQTAPMEVAWVRNWLRQSLFQKFVSDKKNGSGPRTMMVLWTLARTNNGSFHVDRLYEAVTFQLPEALPVALQGLQTKPYMGMSIEAIGRLGGKDYAALLVPLLDDETVLGTMTRDKKRIDILAKDVALAWLVHLSGQKPEDYGMPQASAWFKRLEQSPNHMFSSSSYSVADPDKRAEFRKKWDEWVAKNPLPKPPKDFSKDVPAGPAAVQPEIKPDLDEPEEEPYHGPELAERWDLQRLGRARQLISEESWYAAARELTELVQSPDEKWFQPQRGVPHYRELRSEAERMIAALPEEGLAAVEELAGPVARQLLDEAIHESSIEKVRDVSQRFFFTRVGAAATWRLAMMSLDADRPLDSTLQLERLIQSSPYAASFEPRLSLCLVIAKAKLRKFEQAETILNELRQRYPDLSRAPERNSLPLPDKSGNALDWLRALAGANGQMADGWLMHRGNALRNPGSEQTSQTIPWPEAELLAGIANSELLQRAVEFVQTEKAASLLGRIPGIHPLIIGEVVIYRTATGLQAVDRDGQPLWFAPQEDALWDMTRGGTDWTVPEVVATASDSKSSLPDGSQPQPPVTTPTESEKEAARVGGQIVDGLQQRLLEHTSYGTLSSDGERVFAVESDEFPCPPSVQRLIVDPSGRLVLDTRSLDRGNSLVAYDVQSGRLLWRQKSRAGGKGLSGGTQSSEEFLGTPLIVGSNLFVMVRVGDEVELRQLDRQSGESTRTWLLQTDAPSPPANVFWMKQYPRASSSSHACSPSFSDGTIFCLTPSCRVVAIDLRTGRLSWSWLGPRPRELSSMVRFNPQWQMAADAQRQIEPDHWCDFSLTLADDCVVVAMPNSDELICLEQRDGSVRWSAPRRDALFVAGVKGGNVLVIGREGARAIRVTDGEPAWPAEKTNWPSAAMPSGSGYFSGDRYVVPLNSAEVIAIDVNTGQWLARSRSESKTIPGNLVASRDAIWSLGLDGLRRFGTATTRAETLAVHAANSPDDIDAVSDWGEALLNSGQVAQAIEVLRRVATMEDATRARQLLARVLRDGVPLPADLQRSLISEFDLSEDSLQNRVDLHIQTALGFERHGDFAAALGSLSKIPQIPVTQEALLGDKALTRNESVSQSVRLDRWFQSRFRKWYAATDDATRLTIDQQVEKQLADDASVALLWFGQHSSANSARLRVEEQMDEVHAGQKEMLLRQVVEDGTSQLAATARQRLELQLSRTAPQRAAYVEKFAKDGGAESGLASVTHSPWNGANFTKTVEKRDPKSAYVQHMMFAVQSDNAQLDEPLWLELDTATRKWTLLNASGEKRFELDSAKDATANRTINYSTAVVQARLVGSVLVMWTGMEVAAYRLQDGLGKQLWTQQIYSSQQQPWPMRYIQRRLQRAGRRAAVMFRQQTNSTWWAMMANASFVCVQKDRQLMLLDLLTGEPLWKRDGLPFDCDLVGDAQVICAIPPDEEDAIIFNALDGREIVRRALPEDSEWVAFSGRRLVTWDEQAQLTSLKCVDLVTGKETWQLPFAEGARHHLLESGDIGVLEPSGRFVLLNVEVGKARFEIQLEPLKGLHSMSVFASRGRYIVFARIPDAPAANAGFIMVNLPNSTPDRKLVGGRIFAVDPRERKVDWKAELPDQAVAPALLSDIPLLASMHIVQKQNKQANGTISTSHEYWLNVLNLDTGKIEHNGRMTSGYQLDLQFAPVDRKVEFHSRTEVLTFASGSEKSD